MLFFLLGPRLMCDSLQPRGDPMGARADSLTCRCLSRTSASNLVVTWGVRLLWPVGESRGANCFGERSESADNGISCTLKFASRHPFSACCSEHYSLLASYTLLDGCLSWTKCWPLDTRAFSCAKKWGAFSLIFHLVFI